MNNEHPQPGQWCWFWDVDGENKKILKLKKKKKFREGIVNGFVDENNSTWNYCQPLTEQELIDNGLKEKEQMNINFEKTEEMRKDINKKLKENTEREKELSTMQEQISEELFCEIFHKIDFDCKYKYDYALENAKNYGLIKESALDKARKIMSGVEKTESNFFARHIVLELSRLYESAIAELKDGKR